MEVDSLRDKEIGGGGGGLFTSLTDGSPVKLRVLTIDPMVSKDKWGGTKFAFIVWNYTEDKAQILNKGISIAKEIRRLHLDEDYGANIQKMGVKITTTGQLKETKYSVDPLPNVDELTKEQVAEAKKIRLEDAIKLGQRYSKINSVDELESPEEVITEVEETQDVVIDDDDEDVDLSDIPF